MLEQKRLKPPFLPDVNEANCSWLLLCFSFGRKLWLLGDNGALDMADIFAAKSGEPEISEEDDLKFSDYKFDYRSVEKDFLAEEQRNFLVGLDNLIHSGCYSRKLASNIHNGRKTKHICRRKNSSWEFAAPVVYSRMNVTIIEDTNVKDFEIAHFTSTKTKAYYFPRGQ